MVELALPALAHHTLCGWLAPVPLFFYISRRLRRSTLFPYTTLFRSSERRVGYEIRTLLNVIQEQMNGGLAEAEPHDRPTRSEEHTSELQSLRHLVCRLLLEKKKTCPEPPSEHPPRSLARARLHSRLP